jgi:aminoglycoside phosphotransferase (APT) family kinase protein
MEAYARTIIENNISKGVISIRRFPTGLSHTVFEVITEDDCPYVVRIARPERNAELERGIYWQEKLEGLDIPLPQIYETGKIDNHASDLEDVYPSLSRQQKRELAFQVAKIQQKVHLLSKQHFESAHPWLEVINSIVDRSEREILAKGEERNPYIADTRNRIQAYKNDLAAVKPVAFLYDLNVRNVIVDKGEVTGIIDVDSLWFGDPLLAIGRGKTILMTMQEDTNFISYWCQYLNLSARQLKLVDFYALLYSVRFMGTLGQRLNGNYSLQTDPKISDLLQKIADKLLLN